MPRSKMPFLELAKTAEARRKGWERIEKRRRKMMGAEREGEDGERKMIEEGIKVNYG